MHRPDQQIQPAIARLAPWALVAVVLFAGSAALAQTGPTAGGIEGDLKAITSELEKGRSRTKALKTQSNKLAKDIVALSNQMVALGRKIHQSEDQATRLEQAIADLNRVKADKKQRLAQGRDGQISVIAALQRLSRHPPEALIAQPLSTSDIVRGAILLRATLPPIERRARRLRTELDSLARTQADIDQSRLELASLTDDLKGSQARIQSLLGQKGKLRASTRAAQKREERRVRALASKARNLKELFNQLEKDRLARVGRERLEAEKRAKAAARAQARAAADARAQIETNAKRQADEAARARANRAGSAQLSKLPPPNGTRPISEARGKLWFPATGRVVARYGRTEKTGLTSKGISIRTRKKAHVVATHDGRVVYAGSFRGYGQLLIIEHGEGYHSLISGLGRIDTIVGQWLLAGEPVGVMGAPTTQRPVLYLELRRNGQPINPLPWLAARTSKAS